MSANILGDNLVPMHRTARGMRYEKLLSGIGEAVNLGGSPSDAIKTIIKGIEDDILKTKSQPGQVHVAQVLSAISVQYGNDAYIGEQLVPTVSMGGKLAATYFIYNKRDRFAYPDDKVSARGAVNEISESRSTNTVTAIPRGLEEYVDQLTINNQDAPLNELLDAQQNVLEGLAFLREKRIASFLTTASNFGSNTTAIAAGSRWDSAGGGDPLTDIDNAVSSVWVGRGTTQLIGYCPLAVWNVLKKHPKVLDLFKYNGSSPGMATPDMLAGWFGLDRILVGRARQDTANLGQNNASYSRIWGSNTFGVVRVAMSANLRNLSFAKIFTDMPGRTTDLRYEKNRGAYGGYTAKCSIAESEVTPICTDAGYLLDTVIG